MWNKILRRSLLIIPQLLAFSLLVFALAQWMPGDPLTGRIIQGMDQGSMTATLGKFVICSGSGICSTGILASVIPT